MIHSIQWLVFYKLYCFWYHNYLNTHFTKTLSIAFEFKITFLHQVLMIWFGCYNIHSWYEQVFQWLYSSTSVTSKNIWHRKGKDILFQIKTILRVVCQRIQPWNTTLIAKLELLFIKMLLCEESSCVCIWV